MTEEISWKERIDRIYEKYQTRIGGYQPFHKWMMEREIVGANIDSLMIVKCYNISNKITKTNDDHFMVAVGQEGVGKSTYLLNVCSMVDPSFDCDRICYTLKQFLHFIKTAKKGQSVVIDEGGSVLYSRQAMSARNVGLTKLFTIMRQKNLFVGIAIPNFFVLDTYVRNHRVNSVVDIPMRGKYRLISDALNRVSIVKLNKEGAQSKDVGKVKPVPGTGFRGDFNKNLPGNLDEEEYLIRKADHMNQIVEELDGMDDEQGVSKYVKIKEVAEKLGVSRKSVVNMINDGRVKGKRIGNDWHVERSDFENL